MRPVALFFAVACFAVLGGLAWLVADRTAGTLERVTLEHTVSALDAAGDAWANIRVDGLTVRVSGTAPDEARHVRVIELLSGIVGAARLRDEIETAPPAAQDIPPPGVDLLRTGGSVTVIGRIPSETDETALVAGIRALDGVSEVSDLLVAQDAGAPPGWADGLSFALRALGRIGNGKIRVEPTKISISAVVGNDARARTLVRDLNGSAPEGFSLSLDISAPLPVISPFVLEFSLSAGTAELSACSAATKAGRARILSAARRAGAGDGADCRIGLGSPSPQWPRAADLGIAAIERMGGGRLEMRDDAVRVKGPAGMERDRFDAVMQDLRATLPKMFALDAVLPSVAADRGTAGAGPEPRFVARLSTDGTVGLTGPVQNGMTERAIGTYAESLFGFGRVSREIHLKEGLPDGWSGRVLAGLETLSLLKSGSVEVTARNVAVTGRSDSETIAEEVRDVLRIRLGAGAAFRADVRFDPSLVPPEKPALDPRACEARIGRLLKDAQIVFAPNSVEIEADSAPVMDAIADVLRQCPDARFEIGGHTDSQGREVLNMGLSQSRADAVLDALLSRDVLVAELVARGYGETRPIADNKTEAGRRANRRIEFRLLGETDEPQ